MQEVVKNARNVYAIRNYVIKVFQGSEIKGVNAKGKKKADTS